MTQRLQELDSLRGLAALEVLFSHFFSLALFPPWFDVLSTTPLGVFWSGHEGVLFFFVLSGFVLTLPFLENRAPTYLGYLTKRILRIYPPYILAAGLAMFFRELLFNGPVPGVGSWFNCSWQTPVTWKVFLDHVMMIGSFPNNNYNPVLWSLVFEMRISIVFPALIYLVRRNEKVSMALAALFFPGILFLFYLGGRFHFFLPYVLHTVQYAGVFIIGALLAKKRNMLVQWFVRLPHLEKWFLMALALLFYSEPCWLLPLIANLNLVDLVLNNGLREGGEFFTTAGVCLIIIASLSAKKISFILTAQPFEFLGAISYSLYLYHAVCLKVIVTLLNGHLPVASLLLISFVVSVAVSALSYRYVEIPSIQLGRWVVKRYFSKPAPALVPETNQI